MNSNDLKHNKNLKPNKTLIAIIFSLIFTMFFLSFECNLFGGGDSGGIFIPPPPGGGGGGGPSLSNPALSIDNTERSYSSIFDGSHYYLLSKYSADGTSRLIIHRITSDFSSISSTSFAFIRLGVERPNFGTNILDIGSELITSNYINRGSANYDSAILKINKSSLSIQQHLFFNNTEFPRIIFDNPYLYLSLVADISSSQGYLLVLDNNNNLSIVSQYQTNTTSTGFPDAIFLYSSTSNYLLGVLVNANTSGNVLNSGIFIMSKSNLTSATKIPLNYSFSNNYIRYQNPLITTESGNDYVYFADAIDSHTFYINKISVPTIASGAIASASTKISLPSSSILNININKINNQIVVGISKTESSINKLLFLIFDTSLNNPRPFELYTNNNNNQLYMYQYQKYFETHDNGFILTGNINPSSYKIFFLKFNNLFYLTENNIFNVVNNPATVNITSYSYTLPTIDTITLSPSSLTPSTNLYNISQNSWTSNISTNP
jgi:hypothetical protein